MDWIIILYIIFIIASGIISGLMESKGKRPRRIKPIEVPVTKEEPELIKEKPIVKYEEPKKILEEPKKTKKENIPQKVEQEEFSIEKDLVEKLPEIIALMEIIGPPRAYRGFGQSFPRKSL